jgi:hypothetical protein
MRTQAFSPALFSLILVFIVPMIGQADEPGWTNRIIKRGDDRVESRTTPILERPYRPLHFYGNTVRRTYYRGYPLPLPRDVLSSSTPAGPARKK